MTIDEEKLSGIYQQGKGQGAPARMDDAILAASREALEQGASTDISDNVRPLKKYATVKSPFSGGWPAMASIAAVLVVTVILVPLLDQEAPPVATDMVDDVHELLSSRDDNDDKEHVSKKKQAPLSETLNRRQPQDEGSQQQIPQLNQYQLSPVERSDSESLAVEEAPSAVRSMPVSPSLTTTEPMPSAVGSETREQELKSDKISGKPGDSTSAAKVTPSASLEDIPSAERWLEKIQRLLAEHDYQAAQIELDAFKKHYPDEVIEPSILKQIKQHAPE